MRRLVAPLLLSLFALALAGCGPGGAWIVAALALALVIAGCSESHTVRPDADTEEDAGPVPADAQGDAGGTWGPCCESGRVSSCFCPAGWACNYGLGTIFCADGVTCGESFGSPSDPAERARICGEDAGVDAGSEAEDGGLAGSWEPCCDDTGRITTCFCPAGVECNYGWYTDCGGGMCTLGPDGCPGDLDAGS